MLPDKIYELREKINKLVESNSTDIETLLALSVKLDEYIAGYIRSKGIKIDNF